MLHYFIHPCLNTADNFIHPGSFYILISFEEIIQFYIVMTTVIV